MQAEHEDLFDEFQHDFADATCWPTCWATCCSHLLEHVASICISFELVPFVLPGIEDVESQDDGYRTPMKRRLGLEDNSTHHALSKSTNVTLCDTV